jgi:cobalamin-dependent methionine synthase I
MISYPVREFIETPRRENADIIVASALMTTTMIYMPELIRQLKAALNASTDQITWGKSLDQCTQCPRKVKDPLSPAMN